ncbi:EAL domain-containing protein [Shewanella yunxiaonensis]|uniref:EAL domain-containing protein n=1 Tax=Shewanella yunxiaonensis TaxID=2829809 RepID=A0ABX7YU49_9GAMM|nr:EAL domain-containing protein [Shewanella yunxiaonensis]QUN06160.1 EAL domain-containing protein [Shewanella yunxiaonensis]
MNRQIFAIVVCVIYLLLGSSCAIAGELVQRVFSARDGLGNSAIQDMTTDDYGFIWLATEQGLYRVSNNVVRRVDKSATNSRLDEEYFLLVAKVDHQYLLTVTERNTYLYNIHNNSFRRFGSPTFFPDFDGSALRATAPLPNGDLLLLSAQGKVWRLSKDVQQLRELFSLPKMTDGSWNRMLLLSDGRLVLGNTQHLWLYDQQGNALASLPWKRASGSVYSLYQDSQNRVWISGGDGLYQLDLETLKIAIVPQIPYLCRMVAEDEKGNLWVVIRGGLLKYFPNEHRIISYKDQLKQRAGIDSPNALLIDRHGLVWVAGTGNPLAILAEKPDFLLDSISNDPPYKLNIDTVWSIAADDSSLWLGSNGALYQVNLTSKISDRYGIEGMDPSDSIYRIDAIDAAHWLLSTTNGLYIFDKVAHKGTRLVTTEAPAGVLAHKGIYNVLHEGKNWWLGTNYGLYHWVQGGDIERIHLPGVDTDQERLVVFGLYRDWQHRLWVGGDKFLGYFDSTEVFHRIESVNSDVLKKSMINQILQVSDDTFWLGTRSLGMQALNIKTSEIHSLTDQWQVECDGVYFLEDTKDFRVVGCPKKIIRQNKHNGELLVLGYTDGLIAPELNEGAIYYDAAKGLYVGTPEGVMLLDVPHMKNRIADLGVVLESVSVYFENSTMVSIVPHPGMQIAPGAKLISFQLSNSNYLGDAATSIKYRLREPGRNQTPNYLLLENQSQINLAGLKGGTYNLEVVGQVNGVWNKTPVVFPFEVRIHWWESNWFRALWMLSLLAALIGIIIYRHRQVLRFREINHALTESDDRLRQSLRGSDSDLWEWYRQDNLFYLDNHGDVLGMNSDQLTVKFGGFPMHPDDRPRVEQQWQQVLNGNLASFDAEYRYKRSDGHWGWIKVRGRPVNWDPETGAILKIAGIYSEVTTAKRLESEVSLLARAFENTSEGVLILDANEFIEVANRAAEELVGISRQEMTGKQVGEVMCSGDGKAAHVAPLLEGRSSWTGERELMSRNRSSFPVWLNVSAMKDNFQQLRHYVIVFSDITERKQSEAELRKLANYDVLTGLPNRSLFAVRLEQAITRASKDNGKLALLFLDLDRFKQVNDYYGHSMGDALLVEAANRLQSVLDEGQLLCRFGGDEFVILVNSGDVDLINRLCDRLLSQIAQPFRLFGREFFVSTSIGISIWPDDTEQPENLIKNADQAMYHAKDSGRGNFQYYSRERNAEALYHMRLEGDLRRAIEQDEFELWYQGQFDLLQDDRCIGAEALLRWRHPQDGFVPPDIFIKVAESCGLIIDIDRWVMHRACLDGARLCQQFSNLNFSISVNVSAVHFRQPDFIEFVLDTLQQTGMPANRLTLEITEGVLMKELHIAKQHLRRLRKHNIEVAIDDFGTGYSSLAYLRNFQVNALKIDRSFLLDIATNSADQAIVSSIIELARNLKLSVVAEGVETKEQLEQVFSRGCYVIQGYYFAKPAPLEMLEQQLLQYQPVQ